MSPPASDPGVALTVMTWNLQHASPERARRQVTWAAGRPDADVLILTEVAAGAALSALVEELGRRRYLVCMPEQVQDRLVVVAARVGSPSVVTGVYAGRLAHRVLSVRLALPHGAALGMLGLYVPSRGPHTRRNVDKRAVQQDVTAVLPRLTTVFGAGCPVLVGGDLNVVEPGHRPHHPVFGAWEYAFYRAFTDAGLVDVFRHLHPDVEAHSWYGRSGRGYRFDHLFLTAAHTATVTTSTYEHEPRRLRLSDHAAHTVALLIPVPS